MELKWKSRYLSKGLIQWELFKPITKGVIKSMLKESNQANLNLYLITQNQKLPERVIIAKKAAYNFLIIFRIMPMFGRLTDLLANMKNVALQIV